MKIAVIAAGGRSGRVFVQAALEAGHTVRAGVHSRESLQPEFNLEIVPCDATNIEDITRLLDGRDAVVSLIGHGRKSPPDLQTKTIQNILAAMKQLSITRVVSLTGTGVRVAGDDITIMDRILNLSISLIDPKRIQDGIQHAEILQASDTEWTLLRVLKLTNAPKTAFRLSQHGPVETFTSRRQVSTAILDVLESHSYIQSAPIMSVVNE